MKRKVMWLLLGIWAIALIGSPVLAQPMFRAIERRPYLNQNFNRRINISNRPLIDLKRPGFRNFTKCEGLRGYMIRSYSSRTFTAQARLTRLGLYKGSLDGILGLETKEAIKEFQRSRGLKPDGIIGPRTMKALEEDSAGDTISRSEDEDKGKGEDEGLKFNKELRVYCFPQISNPCGKCYIGTLSCQKSSLIINSCLGEFQSTDPCKKCYIGTETCQMNR